MAWHDRIQTTQQLKKRNWDKEDVCKFCDVEETVNHLLFQCPIARATWCWIRDSPGWPSAPISINNFQDLFLLHGDGDNKGLAWWVTAVGWALWKSRNDLVFSNVVIKSPKQVAYKCLGLMKQWMKLAGKDGAKKEANGGDDALVIFLSVLLPARHLSFFCCFSVVVVDLEFQAVLFVSVSL